MLKIRIIPMLTFNGFGLVKTKQFANPRMVGNAVQVARVFNSRGVDELIFIDIFSTIQQRKIDAEVVARIIRECFMPVGIGGAVSTLDDIRTLLKIGADKVVIKTAAIANPAFVKEAADIFGSQCITVAVDAKKVGREYVVHHSVYTNVPLEDFINNCQRCGAGEFIVTSVDRDGMMNGFDIDLIQKVEKLTTLPIVACGGGGNPGHYVELFKKTAIQAVASSSIFYFTRFTPDDIKKELHATGQSVRII